MDNKPIVILGSARPDSNTKKLLAHLFPADSVKVLDLLDFKVYPDCYSGQYPADDQFLQLIAAMLQHTRLIFATPVYWYAMSGILKTFFDRLTDPVTVQKKTGRQMAGKEIFLIAVGSEEELPPGFETPFQSTSAYFGMKYSACYYCPNNAIHVHTDKRITFLNAVKTAAF